MTQLIDDHEARKHLVFKLAGELYGTPLVTIREIIKMQPIKEVPFMVSYFRGILNLRGQIVSVVDLRMKLDLPCKDKDSGLLVVIDTDNGPIGAIVDDVVSVSDFDAKEVATDLAVKTKIPVEFFKGIGRLQDRLVNLIDIGGTLTGDDFATIRRMHKTPMSA